jgi:hypothetical protein
LLILTLSIIGEEYEEFKPEKASAPLTLKSKLISLTID